MKYVVTRSCRLPTSRREFLSLCTAAAAASAPGPYLWGEGSVSAPAPYGAIPSERQLRWHEMETNAFLHFTVNTFTDKEWGYGDEDPNVFNPADFDADAIVRDIKAGGMKGIILTCKHHDGFCLWPTRTTEHSVRNSRWRNGKGDVVRDISAAARRMGLKFGVYVSPWDRSNAKYATPEYISIYHEQLRELLTNYGPIFEVWFDGANGGDGYYGGAREKRSIGTDYYEWDKTTALVHHLQPGAVIFGAAGDIRWVGNENGVAGDPCWATFTPQLQRAQDDPHASENGGRASLNHGVQNGSIWKPAECDVSIRPGWFWHESQNTKVKTPAQLTELYLQSVGRGANLLLNVPPNNRGLIETADASSLVEFRKRIEKMFAQNLAQSAKLQPSSVRGGSRRFDVHNLVDGDRTTYWATDDTETTPQLVIGLNAARPIGIVRLREAIQLGQRISAFSIDAWQNGDWKEIAAGTSIGSCRLVPLAQPVTAASFRLRITSSQTAIALSEVGLFEPVSI